MGKPRLASAGGMAGIGEAAAALGLNGEGRVIAMIDSEFDTGHKFFEEPVEKPEYTEADFTITNRTETSVDGDMPFAFYDAGEII